MTKFIYKEERERNNNKEKIKIDNKNQTEQESCNLMQTGIMMRNGIKQNKI